MQALLYLMIWLNASYLIFTATLNANQCSRSNLVYY